MANHSAIVAAALAWAAANEKRLAAGRIKRKVQARIKERRLYPWDAREAERMADAPLAAARAKERAARRALFKACSPQTIKGKAREVVDLPALEDIPGDARD